MADREVVLRTQDLGYAYRPGQYAIRHLSIELGRGEVLGLLGRNGAGKTTTVRLLTTLLPPTEGTAWILGQDLRSGGRGLRSRLGVVLQAESLDFVSVERNLDLYAFMWGVPREVAKSRAEEMLELFELGHVRRRKPWALSGGERRRFQVARELMHDMEILFLDEPTVGLDVIMRRTLLDSIRAEVRRGLTVVFTTHNLEEADYLCHRIAVVDQGRLLALDTLENLKRLYGGRKTIDLTVSGTEGEAFYRSLRTRLGEDSTVTVSGRSAVILASDPKGTLAVILDLAQERGVGLDWLNVRQNTLEDVFLKSVGHEGESIGSA